MKPNTPVSSPRDSIVNADAHTEEKPKEDANYNKTAPTPSFSSLPSSSSSDQRNHDNQIITNHEAVIDDPAPEAILVGWDDTPDRLDPENPLNWRPVVKWANILIISVISFLV